MVDIKNLREILVYQSGRSVSGVAFASIDTISTPTLRGGKKNPYQGKIRKIMSGAAVTIATSSAGYRNMMRKILQESGGNPDDFELKPRAWGTRIGGTPIIEHTKDGTTYHYLEVQFRSPGSTEYFVEEDGVLHPIEKDQITGLPDAPDAPVVIRTFRLDNILAIRFGGEEHRGPFFWA